MQILYADESGSTGTDYDNKEQPIFVLGGVVIDKDKWHETNNRFNEEKQKILPILKDCEIHTNELFNSSKKSIFDKYDWKENLKVLEKLADVIEKLDIKFTYVLIDKKEMKKELKDVFGTKVKIDPYIISFCTTYVKFMTYDTNFIQIADIWAFYVSKYVQITKGYKKYSDVKNEHCIKVFKKLNKKLLFGGYLDIAELFNKH